MIEFVNICGCWFRNLIFNDVWLNESVLCVGVIDWLSNLVKVDFFVLFGFIIVIFFFLFIEKEMFFKVIWLLLVYWKLICLIKICLNCCLFIFNVGELVLFLDFKNENIILLVFLFCLFVWNVWFIFLIVL